MKAAGVDVADIGGALEQITYTADEIEALIPLLRRVPAPVLGMPLGSQDTSWSIAAAFAAISARDLKLRESLQESLPVLLREASNWKAVRSARASDSDYEGLAVVLGNVVSGRRSLVETLRNIASSLTNGDRTLLGGRLFELIHDDAEIMREIAYALHSGPVTGELGE